MHLTDVMRATEPLRSFPLAVAALCLHAARRNATWIEIQFTDTLTVRDDGRAFDRMERSTIAMLADDNVDLGTAIGIGGEASLFGFAHHVDAMRFYSWSSKDGDAPCYVIGANRVRGIPGKPGTLDWNRCAVPDAPNTPPKHGTTVRWETLPESVPMAIDAFYLIKRELRAQLDHEIAELVRLRIASLHGTRPLD